MRGPKPKPVELRKLEGNPGRRPIPETAKVPAGLPNCPPHLGGEARRMWQKMGRMLETAGLISRVDFAAFAVYCELWQRYLDAGKAIKALGLMPRQSDIDDWERGKTSTVELPTVKSSEQIQLLSAVFNAASPGSNYRQPNPYLSVQKDCIDRLMKIGCEFGMTPSSRVRVAPTLPAANEDDSFFNS